MRLVPQNTMYTKFCNTPSADVAVCPNVGWLKDFADGQTILSPTFAGKNILEQGNSNWGELDDPAINEAIDKAELLPVEERAAAWGEIDKMIVEQMPGDPVDLGQDPADPVGERQRRGLGVQRPVGPGLHVDQVSSASAYDA